jgi:thiol-disulfide isomerase/thioredoxin
VVLEKNMKQVSLGLALLLAWTASVAAEAEDAAKARQILEGAQKASAQLTSVSYDGLYLGDGMLAKRVPVMDGKVLAKRDPNGGADKVFVQGTNLPPKAAEPWGFRYVSNGSTAMSVDDRTRLVRIGQAADSAMTIERISLYPGLLLGDAVFSAELAAAKLSYEGALDIDSVGCHVIKVTYDAATKREAKFYIGVEDSLLRRKEQSLQLLMRGKPQIASAALIFSISNLETNPAIDDTVFQMNPPQGYRTQPFRPMQQGAAGGLRVGSPAPDWTLSTLDGKKISLKELRGNIVVLDFWASWCGPCKRAMPGIQKLHDTFKGKPVKVFGVNCREQGGNQRALAYLKQTGYTYPQLLNGDSAASAYGVRGIPAFYVIGKDGKILNTTSGFNPNMEAAITRLIEDSLKQ